MEKIGIEKKEMKLSNTTLRKAEVLPGQHQVFLSGLGSLFRGAWYLTLSLMSAPNGKDVCQLSKLLETLKRHF